MACTEIRLLDVAKLTRIAYLFLSLLCTYSFGDSKDFKYVTCGSVIKLLNTNHNVRLHSHEIKYGSGSGQQSVTAVDIVDDANSYWVVRGDMSTGCKRGAPIKCGSTLRLQHLASKQNLHSHLFQSPISHNQEVSAFGDDGVGDEGDEWSIDCPSKYWERKNKVRFVHKSTNVYLHVSGDQFGRPIHGQREVSGFAYPDSNNEWKAVEGIYLKPDTDK